MSRAEHESELIPDKVVEVVRGVTRRFVVPRATRLRCQAGTSLQPQASLDLATWEAVEEVRALSWGTISWLRVEGAVPAGRHVLRALIEGTRVPSLTATFEGANGARDPIELTQLLRQQGSRAWEILLVCAYGPPADPRPLSDDLHLLDATGPSGDYATRLRLSAGRRAKVELNLRLVPEEALAPVYATLQGEATFRERLGGSESGRLAEGTLVRILEEREEEGELHLRVIPVRAEEEATPHAHVFVPSYAPMWIPARAGARSCTNGELLHPEDPEADRLERAMTWAEGGSDDD